MSHVISVLQESSFLINALCRPFRLRRRVSGKSSSPDTQRNEWVERATPTSWAGRHKGKRWRYTYMYRWIRARAERQVGQTYASPS